jgi:ERCC4-related helicase
VYNASAQGTLFYMDRLAHHLAKAGIKAASVVGKKHLSSAERDENLTLFDKHEVQVLGINSAANEGLHMQAANTLVRLSHSSRPIDIEQVLGRVGRKDRPAYIYNVVTIGTHDEYRFYAGLRNQKRMRQAIQTAQGLMFTGPGSLEE